MLTSAERMERYSNAIRMLLDSGAVVFSAYVQDI
jgi:hypothetical protein